MNNIAHQKMVQEALKKKFRGHKNLLCKAVANRPQSAEREYQRILGGYIRLLNRLLKENLPEIGKAAQIEKANARHDDAIDIQQKISDVFRKIAVGLEAAEVDYNLRLKIESMALQTRKMSVREWKKLVKSTLGIDLQDDYYSGELFRDLMNTWVDNNVGLIKTIPQDTLGKMQDIVTTGFRDGITATMIMHEVQEAYGITKRHARLIARDQIAKLNGQITRRQQEDAGVSEYIWSTSKDARVRDSHAELDGKRFRWDDPPIVDFKTGRRCHPGEDYQCRCVALPVFDFDRVDLPIQEDDDDE